MDPVAVDRLLDALIEPVPVSPAARARFIAAVERALASIRHADDMAPTTTPADDPNERPAPDGLHPDGAVIYDFGPEAKQTTTFVEPDGSELRRPLTGQYLRQVADDFDQAQAHPALATRSRGAILLRALADEVDQAAALRARLNELEEQLASIVAGCVNADRDELVRRITAIGPERWKAGSWLDEKLEPLRQQIRELEAMDMHELMEARDVTGVAIPILVPTGERGTLVVPPDQVRFKRASLEDVAKEIADPTIGQRDVSQLAERVVEFLGDHLQMDPKTATVVVRSVLAEALHGPDHQHVPKGVYGMHPGYEGPLLECVQCHRELRLVSPGVYVLAEHVGDETRG